MAMRVDKYGDEVSNYTQSRTNRNKRLYREVYDEYGDLDNLPLADNTNEIDINTLKELISDIYNNKDESRVPDNFDISFLENRKRNIDENKVYDINKLLEKAKYENDKLKDSESELLKTSRSILSRLDVDDYKINNDYSKDVDSIKSNNLEMTREMKYHTKKILDDPLTSQVMPDNDLAMDLFFDLKPTGDTIVTKPIKDMDNDSNDEVSIKEVDVKKDDDRDIDIIKKNANNIDNDFFTSSYTFSSKDFNDDGFDEIKSNNMLKIVFLIVCILILCGIIFYFVINYGLGA